MSKYSAERVRIFIDKTKLKQLNEIRGEKTLTLQFDEIITDYLKMATESRDQNGTQI